MRIGVLTDSTASITAARAAELSAALQGRFGIVDLSVSVGEETRPDRQWTAAEVCAGMGAGLPVTTSLATTEQFSAALDELSATGAEAVIVPTLSARLSGTHQAALAAVDGAAVPVHVIDTGLISAGLEGAVQVAASGACQQIAPDALAAEVADWCQVETRTFFIPDDLEYLRRGGRIGAAASLFGRALAIAPVLGLREGIVAPLARVRTRARAVERVISLVSESAYEFAELYPERRQEIVVLHAEGSLEDAGELAQRLDAAVRSADLPGQPVIRRAVLSTVVTAHVGPGSVGVVVQTIP